jgi:hypothetical protein
VARRRLLIATPLIALVAAACTSTASYKDQTEEFLNDDSQVETAVEGDVSGASCEEPASTDVGETYTCTAEVEGRGTATFDVRIDAEDSFLVENFEIT